MELNTLTLVFTIILAIALVIIIVKGVVTVKKVNEHTATLNETPLTSDITDALLPQYVLNYKNTTISLILLSSVFLLDTIIDIANMLTN